METVKRIELSRQGSYTVGVMEWADEHPDARFDHTEVYDTKGRYCMMVSEYEPTETDRECECLGTTVWRDMKNGWQREHTISGTWVCRKGERHIIITI